MIDATSAGMVQAGWEDRQSLHFVVHGSRWRKLLEVVVTLLGLEDSGFTLGCLQGGGPTSPLRTHRKIGHLLCLGGWQSARTFEHYLHKAHAAVMAIALSDRSKHLLCGQQGSSLGS